MLALVDWDTTRRFGWVRDPTRRARLAVKRAPQQERLLAVFEALANTAMANFKEEKRIQCDVRIYHGWHRGKTPTDDFVELAKATDLPRTLRQFFHVSRIELATSLIFAGESSDATTATLFATVRRQGDSGDDEQKMVDTALCSDMLHWARRRSADRKSLIFVMGEDDDLYPPVAVSNHWGVRARILRMREAQRHMPWMERFLLRPMDE